MIEKTGSVRVDLLGGTIDLNPINLILPHVVTLNVATSLRAHVTLEKVDFDGVEIVSKDYQSESRFPATDFTYEKLMSGYFKELTFVAQILDLFKVHRGVRLTMQSGSPPGAGLGGSSAMGVTLYSALCDHCNVTLDRIEAITKVNSIEGRILDSGPAGYQDYYPALFGGVLALKAAPGTVEVEQLYSEDLKKFLESHLSLVYSGETRHSGMNNWEVYKGFFDKKREMREGLSEIAALSYQAYQALQGKNYDRLAELIASEGATRAQLFPGIVSNSMKEMYNKLKGNLDGPGMKVCGAGGGGCFLLVHKPQDASRIIEAVNQAGMRMLDFSVSAPL